MCFFQVNMCKRKILKAAFLRHWTFPSRSLKAVLPQKRHSTVSVDMIYVTSARSFALLNDLIVGSIR